MFRESMITTRSFSHLFWTIFSRISGPAVFRERKMSLFFAQAKIGELDDRPRRVCQLPSRKLSLFALRPHWHQSDTVAVHFLIYYSYINMTMVSLKQRTQITVIRERIWTSKQLNTAYSRKCVFFFSGSASFFLLFRTLLKISQIQMFGDSKP